MFQTMRETDLVGQITPAKRLVIYAAPGMSPKVAEALASLASHVGAHNIIVILDATAQTAYLGYGQFSTLDTLQAAGITPRMESGLRQGLLIVDNRGWAFTLLAQLVEAEAKENEFAPNAIELTSAQVAVLRSELPQPADTPETGESAPHKPKNSLHVQIGKQPVTPEQVDQVKQELQRTPPRPFSLERQVNVYNAFVRFVELKLDGWRLESHTVKLPKDLPLLATQDEDLKDRIRSSLRIMEGINSADLNKLRNEVEALREEFCKPIGDGHRVILRSRQKEFQRHIDRLQEQLKHTRYTLLDEISDTLEASQKALVQDLARTVYINEGDESAADSEGRRRMYEYEVRTKLQRVFPRPEKLIQKMGISLIYKDVTYEMLSNKSFKNRVLTAFNRSDLPEGLIQQYDAVLERKEHRG